MERHSRESPAGDVSVAAIGAGERGRGDLAAGFVADVRQTLTNAQAKGGSWKELAEQELMTVITQVDDIDGRLAEARNVLGPLAAAAQQRREEADLVLGRVSDDLWNDLGRPRSDTGLAVLFPGGVAAYTDADVKEQPDRMDLLAELLETKGHPRLAPDALKAQAQRVRAAAQALRGAQAAAAPASARVEVLQRVARAIVVNAQAALSRLKRLYKNAGFTETDIHTVIPDRPIRTQRAQPQPEPQQPPPSPAGAPR